MGANVGGIDRVLRIIVGLALIGWALNLFPGIEGSAWGWIGVVPLLTALIGFCPLYRIIGVNTCGVKRA